MSNGSMAAQTCVSMASSLTQGCFSSSSPKFASKAVGRMPPGNATVHIHHTICQSGVGVPCQEYSPAGSGCGPSSAELAITRCRVGWHCPGTAVMAGRLCLALRAAQPGVGSVSFGSNRMPTCFSKKTNLQDMADKHKFVFRHTSEGDTQNEDSDPSGWLLERAPGPA